jgi:hypothetical protein
VFFLLAKCAAKRLPLSGDLFVARQRQGFISHLVSHLARLDLTNSPWNRVEEKMRSRAKIFNYKFEIGQPWNPSEGTGAGSLSAMPL